MQQTRKVPNRKSDAEVRAAAATLKIVNPIERWDLSELIAVSSILNLISSATKAAAEHGRGFRNLIHPGRAQRLAVKCNKATALLGAGALEAVLGDLNRA